MSEGFAVPNQNAPTQAETQGQPPPASPQAPAAQQGHWSDTVENIPDETKAWLRSRSYKGPNDALVGYHNLEKSKGVPAERLVTLPADAEDKDGWGEVYNRLGRPESPDGYEFEGYDPETVEGVDLIPGFREKAHELGFTAGQANGLYKWFTEQMTQADEQANAEFDRTSQAELLKVKRDWGNELFEENKAAFQRMATQLGWPQERFDKIERALGTAEFMESMVELARSMGESRPLLPDGRPAPHGYTPAMATERMNQLKSDPAWVERYLAGGSKELKEWQELIAIETQDQPLPAARTGRELSSR